MHAQREIRTPRKISIKKRPACRTLDVFFNLLIQSLFVFCFFFLAIGARHITVSTSGIVPKIYDYADEGLQVNLAISIHAPTNELRSRIMKINKAYPIEKLMAAIDYYLEKSNRRITFEYILLRDVNDHVEEANLLAKLLEDKRHLSYVNLIPYNSVSEHDQYQQSTPEAISAFYDALKKKGINCGVRQEQGADIDAACGQLRSKQIKKEKTTV